MPWAKINGLPTSETYRPRGETKRRSMVGRYRPELYVERHGWPHEAQDFYREIELRLICFMRFGAHLYGTETEDSDLDYKGVAFPTRREVCLGRIPKCWSWTPPKHPKDAQKNKPGDVDIEIYSLQHFMKLALAGETVALDMLHARGTSLLIEQPAWLQIRLERKSFYTKNLKAFVGYAQRQAAKYGIKGSRLAVMDEFISLMRKYGLRTDHPPQLKHFWELLPQTEHSRYVADSPNGIRQYEICGRILQETVSCQYACECVELARKNYGERAEQAKRNEGIDWKALSHAIRAAEEVRQILTTGDIMFPLDKAGFIRNVKQGSYDFLTVVQPELEGRIAELQRLSEESDLPEKPDTERWEFAVQNMMMSWLCRGGEGWVTLRG